MLENLLGKLDSLQTEGRFTYSVDVIDNDAGESAKRIVEAFAKKSKVMSILRRAGAGFCPGAKQGRGKRER